MNRNTWIYLMLFLIIGLIVFSFIRQETVQDESQDANSNTATSMNQPQNVSGTTQSEVNKNNCLADDCLEVDGLVYPAGQLSPEIQNALDTAIDDEYKARATYEAVINKFGLVRPFSMIIGAEEQHIASLKAIYTKYGLDVPTDKWSNNVTAPSTLKEACQAGVDAEIANASLYRDKLLPAVEGHDDIINVFTNLMNASQNKHLRAFDRCN